MITVMTPGERRLATLSPGETDRWGDNLAACFWSIPIADLATRTAKYFGTGKEDISLISFEISHRNMFRGIVFHDRGFEIISVNNKTFRPLWLRNASQQPYECRGRTV